MLGSLSINLSLLGYEISVQIYILPLLDCEISDVGIVKY